VISDKSRGCVAARLRCGGLFSCYLTTYLSLSLALKEILQEGLAVASIVQDDPSPLPGMHREHNALPSQTGGH